MARIHRDDTDFMTDVRAAVGRGPRLSAHLILLTVALFFALAVAWADRATLDQVATGRGRVIPSGQVQIIQNLEGGILADIAVAQGDQVDEGQILLTIDDTQAASRLRGDRAKELALVAVIARLEAEAEGRAPVFPEVIIDERPDLVESETALYQARQAELRSALDVLRQQREQRVQELRELEARITQLIGSLEKLREELAILGPLVEQGVSARIDLIRLERQENDIAGELETTRQAIPRVRAALNEVDSRMGERRAAFRTLVASELAAARGELASIREAVASSADRVRRTDVRAPVSGVVKQVLVNTVGGVVQPGQNLVEIVPLEDNLLVETRIRPSDIAFLRPDLPAKVKFTAYDFAVYGGLDGVVEQISVDTITDPTSGETYYQARVRTERNFLVDKSGETLPIIPGMIAEVDILTGKKTVLEYLLNPILRAKDKAFRER